MVTSQVRTLPVPGLLRPELIATCQQALDLDADEVPAMVRRLADPPSQRRSYALVAGAADGVAVASVDDREPTVGHLDLLAVRPAAQGHGTGRALVLAAEQALAAAGVREVRWAGNPPCYLWPGVDVGYTPAICCALALGYQQYQAAHNVVADLRAIDLDTAGTETRLAASGVTVRAAAPADRTMLLDWARSTWNDTWAGEIAAALDPDRPTGGCHIAIRDISVLGFAAYGANRPSWFGPMGTDPAARGLGVGSVLLRRCLAQQRAAGIRRVQIAWAGPIAFYSRAVGGRLGRIFWQLRRELR